MMFSFNFKSAFLLFFFLHGVIFSTLLLVKGARNRNKADCWLGLFILLCAGYVCPFMLGYAGWYSGGIYREIMFYVPFQQLLLIPPVLYFYTHFLLNKDFALTRRHFVHFIPASLYLAYSLVVFVTDKLMLQEHFFYADGRDKDFSAWYQVAGFITLGIYVVASLNVYKRYKFQSYESLSFADSVLFRWAQHFLAGLLLLLLLRAVFFLTNPEWGQFGQKFWYYFSFSILYYYLSISGYVNSVRSVISLNTQNTQQYVAVAAETAGEKESQSGNQPAIENLDEWARNIERLMVQDRLFANPGLTIADLSARLHTHSKKASQVIHQAYGMNFNDFINSYRANEVIQKMEAGEHNLQTLLGIAYDCGFNSKSTFNRAFKKTTGLTPKDYLQKITSKEVPNPDLKPPLANT
jgi:AraC-like DNA-binding protein